MHLPLPQTLDGITFDSRRALKAALAAEGSFAKADSPTSIISFSTVSLYYAPPTPVRYIIIFIKASRCPYPRAELTWPPCQYGLHLSPALLSTPGTISPQAVSCTGTLATLVEYIMIIIQRLMDPFPYLGLSQSFGTITAEPSRASSTQSYLVSLVLNRTSCIIAQELSKWHINYPLMGSHMVSMSAFERTSAKSYIALLISNNILNMMTYDLFLSASPPSRPLIMLCSALKTLSRTPSWT